MLNLKFHSYSYQKVWFVFLSFHYQFFYEYHIKEGPLTIALRVQQHLLICGINTSVSEQVRN